MKPKQLLFFSFIISFLLVGCWNRETQKIKNEEIGRKFVKYWSAHDSDNFLGLFANVCLYEEVCSGRTYTDKDGILNYFLVTISGVPDCTFELVSLIANDTMVSAEWVWKGDQFCRMG